MPTQETIDFWEKLDLLGVDEVRLRLATKKYGAHTVPLVREWLARQDQILAKEAKERASISETEQVDILRSSRDAAWASARAAEQANSLSIGAIIVSVVALIVSTIALFVVS